MASSRLGRIFVGKAARVFISGLVSVTTPIYLTTLGYSPLLVGFSLLIIVGGGVFSNILLLRVGERVGHRAFLFFFSALMVASGFVLYLTTNLPLMLLAFFIGNISTTGTEAGPFQSVETGVLPMLVSPNRLGRLFGAYNILGYGAASLGALSASFQNYFQNRLEMFHFAYLVYGIVGVLLLIVYSGLGNMETSQNVSKPRMEEASSKSKEDIRRLSLLSSLDAFGGGFVSQSLLSYWFYLAYDASLASLGIIFFIVNIITAASTFGASLIAERFGNLRIMVTTHLLSNVFLLIIPFAGSLTAALAFLFLRQSVSQMDVPTRQAFMAEIFNERDRVAANAATNASRSVGSLFGGPISGAFLGAGLLALPIITGGVSKIVYDVSMYLSYGRNAE